MVRRPSRHDLAITCPNRYSVTIITQKLTVTLLARLVAKISKDEKYYAHGKVILKKLKAKEQLQLAKHNLPIDSVHA